VFDRLDELVSDPSFRGCRYFACDLALADPEHPAHAQTATFRRRLHALLARELESMGRADPERDAQQLHLLIEGTLVMGDAARSPAGPFRARPGRHRPRLTCDATPAAATRTSP
jgi:hypothetical protein